MKRLTSALTVLAVGVVFTPVATAQDVEAIKNATMEHFATQAAGDAAAHVRHHMLGHTAFAPDGGRLQKSASLEEESKNLQANFDAGLKWSVDLRDLKVDVYGDAAVVTGYLVGTVTLSDGSTQPVNNRRTAVLIKQGSEWKEVHTHISNLTDTATEEASIREVLTQHLAAFESQDWEAVGSLTSDDWVIVTHLGTTLDRAGIQAFFEEHITDHSITISNIDVTVSGDGLMAWAKFDENTQYNFDGAPVDEDALFTAILEKGYDGWKVVHLQRTIGVEGEM